MEYDYDEPAESGPASDPMTKVNIDVSKVDLSTVLSSGISLGETIAQELAERLVTDTTVRALVNNAIDGIVRDRAERAVRDAIDTPRQRTDAYGAPRGGMTTLNEEILSAAERWMNELVDDPTGKRLNYGVAKCPRIDATTKQVVAAELGAVIDEVRAEIGKRIRNRLSAALREALVEVE